jgi:hypothetical protein
MDISARGGGSVSRPSPGPIRATGGLQPLDGHIAFSTKLKGTFITATGGGGHTTDAIHTDATDPRSWEWFRLWTEEGSEFYALQTIDGHFVTAVDAGGRTTDTIHTDATSVASWELFNLTKLFGDIAEGSIFVGFGLQTTKGYFLTAVGGGGHNSGDSIHTDATVPDTVVNRSWELFTPWRGSQFGTGSTYGILIWGGNGPDEADLRGWMVARGGGGDPDSYAVWLAEEGEYPSELSWTLLKQLDGTYALQTFNGTVLSAVGGGAPGVGGFRSDIPVDSISDSEKFTFEDQGDFTVCIKTFNGTYISMGEGIVAGQSYINRALKFRLQLFDLAPGPTG